jgi:mannose-1-phosphate guanylyltransferase
LNASDIICDYPLKEMLEFHKNHKGSATMLITVVEEPKNFGVVLFDNNNKITNFIGMWMLIYNQCYNTFFQ